MADRANVSSVDALKDFRAHLIVYLTKARPILEEVSSDVSRTRQWLQTDQRAVLEGELRRRNRQLEEAQTALFNSRVSHFEQSSSGNQLSVAKAKRAVEETENKLRTLRLRDRQYDSQVEPLAKDLNTLHTVLANDMPKAVAYLTSVIDTLEAYARMTASPASPESEPAAPKPETPEATS